MRNTIVLFALLCLGLTWVAISAAAPGPESKTPIPIARAKAPTILTRNEIIQGVRNREGQFTPHRQALAMAGLMADVAQRQGTSPALPGKRDDIAYWPLTSQFSLWTMSKELPSRTKSESIYATQHRTLLTLGIGGLAIDPAYVGDWFEAPPPDTTKSTLPEVPQEVWEARALLRPLQIWQAMYGDPASGATSVYHYLRLAPNPGFVRRLDDHFDRAEFFHFRRQGMIYGLLLTKDETSWLWTVDRPSHNHAGEFAMHLYTDTEALRLTDTTLPKPVASGLPGFMRQPGSEAGTFGTLADLLRDAPKPPMEWALMDQTVAESNSRQ